MPAPRRDLVRVRSSVTDVAEVGTTTQLRAKRTLRSGHTGDVLQRNKDGTQYVRVPVFDAGSEVEGDMPLWLFAEVRRPVGEWVPIALSENDRRGQEMKRLLGSA